MKALVVTSVAMALVFAFGGSVQAGTAGTMLSSGDDDVTSMADDSADKDAAKKSPKKKKGKKNNKKDVKKEKPGADDMSAMSDDEGSGEEKPAKKKGKKNGKKATDKKKGKGKKAKGAEESEL